MTKMAATPSGCTHCGLDQRGHCQRWTEAAGWHGYAPPTQQQIKERMLARADGRARSGDRT